MAAQQWLDDLDQALAAAGIPYTEIGPVSFDPTGASSWRDRGRPPSTGGFDASGVLCHHTASPAGTSDQADLNVLIAGNSEAPGPVSQLYIGRSATVYLVAAGRSNHAGSACIPWIAGGAKTDGNAHLIGIEVGNNGTGERWSDPVTTVYGAVVNALCAWYGWELDRVVLHATTGPPAGNHKIDPAGPWALQPDLAGGGAGTWDLETWRGFVADCGAPAPPDEGDIVTDDDIQRIAERVWQVALHNYQSGEEQAALYLLGFAHAEAYDGSFKRTAQNMTNGELQPLADLIRFTHYEAANANAKVEQVLRHLGLA